MACPTGAHGGYFWFLNSMLRCGVVCVCANYVHNKMHHVMVCTAHRLGRLFDTRASVGGHHRPGTSQTCLAPVHDDQIQVTQGRFCLVGSRPRLRCACLRCSDGRCGKVTAVHEPPHRMSQKVFVSLLAKFM